MHYLDNSATTPLCEPVKRTVAACMDRFGNPSSLHRLGMDGLQILDDARACVAKLLGAEPREITFTSGGTESNNTAIFGVAKSRGKQGKHLITTKIEHPSVLQAFRELETQGFAVTYLTPDANGIVTPQAVADAMRTDTILVSVMTVNNEVGSVMDIAAIADVVHKGNALLHTDAVQAFGKIDLTHTRADLISVSGHKIHAPKGIGALYVKRDVHLPPLLVGGGQEKNQRSGTESTLLIAALGAAAQDVPPLAATAEQVRALQQAALQGLQEIDGIVVHSKADNLPYIINFSLPGLPSEVMLHSLEAADVFVSSGSACAKREKSHVLTAMGVAPAAIDSAVRVSMSRFTTREDIDALIDAVQSASRLVRRKR